MKRSTAILLAVFLALVGLMLYLNQKEPATQEAGATPVVEQVDFLFSENDGHPTSIGIKSKAGRQVRLVRNQAGAWVLIKPVEAEADQASAEAAASQLTALRVISKPEVAPDEAGLIPSSYILTVEFTAGTKKTVRIGDLTPTGSGYYARIDGSGGMLIISQTGLDALLALLETPPYLEATATSTP